MEDIKREKCLKIFKKVIKSDWWMPWLSEAKKDVIGCEKLRGGVYNLRSVDIRMGQPILA